MEALVTQDCGSQADLERELGTLMLIPLPAVVLEIHL